MIKNAIFSIIAMSLMLSMVGCASFERGAVDFYVAPNGSDTSPGTKAKPFLTLNQARVAVREKLQAGQKKDIIVLIRGGHYILNDTLKFDQNDSGTNDYKVIYKNYPGETPIFSGGRKVTGWSKVPDSDKWQANLEGVDNSRELYVDGVLAQRAAGKRTETTGWKAADDPNMEKYNLLETFKSYQGDLQVYEGYKTTPYYKDLANWKNQSDIEFCYEHGWTFVICPVQTMTPAEDGGVIIKMRNPCFRDSQIKSGLQIGDPSYIQNAYELLDEPGEWYYDRSQNVLYYIPLAGQDMQQAEVMMPAIETLLEVKGTLDALVHDITFEGLVFEYGTFLAPSKNGFAEIQATLTKDPDIDNDALSCFVKTTAGVLLDAAEGIHFERCGFSRMGAAGINIQNGSKNNIIRGCRITEIGGSGIQIGDFNREDAQPEDPRTIVKDNLVSNCYLNKIATIYKCGVGVTAGFTEGTKIIHNDISDASYSGISIGWGWGLWDAGGRTDFPDDVKFDTPTVAVRNKVKYNHVYRTVQKLTDGGAIYTLSMMEGTVIKGNWIHESNGWPGGIYLDEGSGGIEITGNVVYDVEKWYFYHDVGIEGREQTCHVYDNYFDIKPGQEGFPTKLAQKAGLEPEYSDIKD